MTAVPLARAIEAVRRSGVDKKTYASVLGDDLLAVLTTLVAVEENQFARLVATSEATLRIGEQFGIRHRALADTGRRQTQTSNVLAIAGGALLAGGIVWKVLDRPEDSLVVTPVAIGGRAGLRASLTF